MFASNFSAVLRVTLRMLPVKTACVAGLWCLITISVGRAQESKPGLTVVFEGNKVFSQKELLDVANKCLAEIPDEPRAMEYCLRNVRLFMNSRGYLKAVVNTPLAAKAEAASRLVVSIEEGSRYRIGEISISGSKVFSAAHLLELSPIKSGDIANSKSIATWLFELIPRAYADLGYIQFTTEPVPHFRETTNESSDAFVDFEISVEEGSAFTVRSIKFEGNGATPAAVLLDQMLLRPGDFYSRQRYEDSIKRINQLELFESIDPDKDVNLKSDNETPALDITIKVIKTG